jgi:hypothetical protein
MDGCSTIAAQMVTQVMSGNKENIRFVVHIGAPPLSFKDHADTV